MPIIQTTDLNAFIKVISNSDLPHPVYFKQASGYTLSGRSTFPSYNPPKYGLTDIPALVWRLCFLHGFDRSLEDSTIRYVISNDASHTPYFSLDGSEKGDVSAHERLSSQCLAAGMLRFKECNGHIVLAGIDNNSGYFQPASDCLIWPLKMLLSTHVFQLNATLQLHCRIEGVATCFTLDTNALLSQVLMLTPTVSSFAQQQSGSDFYEILQERIQQQEATKATQQNEFMNDRQLPYGAIEAMSVNERPESLDSPVKRRKLTSAHTQTQSLHLVRQVQLGRSLKKIGFSETSAFTIWQPRQSSSLAECASPSPTP